MHQPSPSLWPAGTNGHEFLRPSIRADSCRFVGAISLSHSVAAEPLWAIRGGRAILLCSALSAVETRACTPDIYVFDRTRQLVYRGQFDDSRPGNGLPVTGADLRTACDALLAGHMPAADQKPSIGCNIKWKPCNEPDYFG